MIIFTCGGTGGHISPALTIAKGIKEDVCFIGGNRLEKKMITDYKFIEIKTSRKNPFSILKSIINARKILKELNPKLIFATGGYVTVPVGIAAITRKIPLVLLEQNSIAGRTNRLLAKFAKVIFLGYPIDKFHPQKSIVTGNPVEKPKRKKKTKLLIIGGSQGSAAVNELIKTNIEEIEKIGLDIIWITGRFSYENVSNFVKKRKSEIKIEVSEFRNDMLDLLAETKLAISRSGAMSVAELSENKIPTLYIPYPYAMDNHQVTNAEYIVSNGGGEMIEEINLNEKSLIESLAKLNKNHDTYKNALKKLPNNATGIIINTLTEKGLLND